MLPECRSNEYLFPIPKYDVKSDSIGAGKQYCGNIGKVDNCQVGVFAGYASPKRSNKNKENLGKN